jgi:hypothetical protein
MKRTFADEGKNVFLPLSGINEKEHITPGRLKI